MIAEINGVISSARALTDLVKANKSLAKSNELVAAVSEVSAQLISAQAAVLASQEKQSALSERIRELEKEIGELKNWKREAERYQLAEITPGIPAYVMKLGMENGEPSHNLCANCFARNQKSFLQHLPVTGDVRCSQCGGTWCPSGGRSIGTSRLVRT